MKINPTYSPMQHSSRVREKSDPTSHSERKSNPNADQDSQGSSDETPDQENPSSEKLGEAIESFQADEQAQSNGLEAQLEGTGPGLKVVLKDGAGGVIRQFTGQEFIRLREATLKGEPARGKILDRKL